MSSTASSTRITAKGRELASKLNPAIGTTAEIERTCSLIARHATTHTQLAEILVNGGTYGHETRNVPDSVRNARIEWAEERTETIERRITGLVEDLPHTDDGPFGVTFQGDPRGCTVKITAPGEWSSLYDGWGQDGVIVPQS
jgi:hypothetical protein